MAADPDLPAFPPASPAPPRSETADLIDPATLARLNRRRDRPALLQLLFHLGVLLAGALAWSLPLRQSLPWGGSLSGWWLWPVGLAGLFVLGSGLAMAFCAMHECCHRTAFSSRGLNDAVAWWAGVLSFYNADFYRRYHQWHHRYTHLPGLDPELEDAPPASRGAYLLEISGLPWWIGKLRGHLAGLRGDFRERPYISAEAVPALTRSIRLQLALYALIGLASLPAGNGFLLLYWLLPLAVGQPLLRFVLLAEHGGCAFVADGLRNTRTTRTLLPLRLLMWNMPFHAEHHLFPSLPFHALAGAHALLAPRLACVEHGYLAVHRGFLASPGSLALPPRASWPVPAGSAAGASQP